VREKPKRMTASKMDKRITYLTKYTKQGHYNEEVEYWLPVTDPNDPGYDYEELEKETVWASVEPIRGREYYESAQLHSEVTHRIRHLYKEIDPTQVIWVDDRIFEIQHCFDVDERGFEVEVMAKEIRR